MKKRKLFFILLFLLISLFTFKQFAFAQDDPFGLGGFNLVLDNEIEPKSAIVNIINIVLGFLGLIAVIIVIYGGFVWMLSGGQAEKIDKAKKILKNGLIGIIIILLSWGIATFVIGFFAGGGGGGTSPSTCIVGDIRNCGCENTGTQVCLADGTWGACSIGPCPGIIIPDIDCNSSDALGNVCQIDQSQCDPLGLVCSPITCKCVSPGSAGSSCSDDPLGECSPNNNLCGEYLTCNDECICEGAPVITEISPMGGFCEDDLNSPCVNDDECVCNNSVPNGAFENLISIYGANFGNTAGRVFFGDELTALEPRSVNSNCIEYWSDKQIIVAVPNGSGSMPVSVLTVDGKQASTNDGIGPSIPDFQFNDIRRPGLCLLSPNSGVLNDDLVYHGVNMFGGVLSDVFFGLYHPDYRIRALSPSFHDDGLKVEARVANISTGLTSTFVQGSIAGHSVPLYSNYISFYKNPELTPSPYISNFEPKQGAKGQYVTIYGQGFGSQRGAKVVKIGNTEVDYDFPAVCADSVWSDSQIIVKVPTIADNGDYIISIEYPGGEIINTENLNPDKFKVNNSLPLLPSLCKISPIRGQIGQQVSFWGEYFGTTQSQANFHIDENSDVVDIIADGLADKIEVNVPEDAISGPAFVKNVALEGNSLNFEIGPCQTDDECGTGNFCCPAGTYKANRCESSLDQCSLEVLNSVYQWSFSTGLGQITDPEGPEQEDSCLGWARKIGACPLNQFCPNSPGVCSVYPNSIQGLNIRCGDDACADLGCVDCSYSDDLNICIPNSGINCDLAGLHDYSLNGQNFSAYRSCQWYEPDSLNRWHMTVNTSCPDDWIMTVNNVCVSDEICDACENNLVCRDIYNTGDGMCVSQTVCPSNSYCNIDECVREVAGSCECCCEHGQDQRDCCTPLQCKGECGIIEDEETGKKYGNCYGCTVFTGGSINQNASNLACNCEGHINKYCDTSVPEGVCADCSVINNESDCLGQNTCCWDDMTSECRGGDRIDSGDDEGFCAYYDCTASGDTCDIGNQLINGPYSTIPQCNLACSNPEEHCNNFDNPADCGGQPNCCWDAKNGADVCRVTIGGNDGKISGGDNNGYCAYYNCDEEECDLDNPTINGQHSTIASCNFSCSGGSGNMGTNCFNQSSNECDYSFCAEPFSCLNEDGNLGNNSNCGRCCCEVLDENSCNLPNTSGLTCQPNRDPCTGDGRGLCCGCSDDDSCGSPEVSGCGSDTCCRTRPTVTNFTPADNATNICRNSVIKVEFDQFMRLSSLSSNIRLLEERDFNEGPCPGGTFFTDNRKKESNNIFARLWRGIRKVFYSPSIAAPDPENLYCLVPGSVRISQVNDHSIATFYPNQLLRADTKHYVLVIGDEDLNSQNGVLSLWQIGMNGNDNPVFNTVEYKNSRISSFTTLGTDAPNSGVCALDYVKITPDSYLFNRNDDDLNEDDSNVNEPTFDTIRDQDKLFTASTYSIDHQEIQGISGYDWDLKFEISMGSGTVITTKDTDALQDNQLFIKVKDDVRDDIARLRAEVDMSAYADENNSFIGDGAYNTANIYVFICRNPWPSIKPNGSWEPFQYDFNSKFYYCRDFGSSAYVDDLPAVIDEPIQVTPTQRVCSLSGNDCNDNDDCEGGEFCINRIIKEAYFFRQQGPSAGEITSAENVDGAPLGGEIELTWTGSKNYIYDGTDVTGNNRIYYGKKGSGSMNYFDLSLEQINEKCNIVDDNNYYYECKYVVSGLENNQVYVFRVSAISRSKIETMFKNEVEATPQDTVPPVVPVGCIKEYNPGAINLKIECFVDSIAPTEDVYFLRFYHGLSSGQYGQSFDGQIGLYSITLETSMFNNNTTHYFAVSSVDKAGNESDISDEIAVVIEDEE